MYPIAADQSGRHACWEYGGLRPIVPSTPGTADHGSTARRSQRFVETTDSQGEHVPRPERLLDPTAGPLEAFAHDLRALRTRAGKPSYRAMALQAHYSVATLSEAARGLQKPSLKVTLAYVAACGGDLEAWSRRWHSVSEALEVRGGQARGRPGGADRNRNLNRNTGRGDDHDRGAARRDQERSRHRLGGDGDAERRYGVDGDVDRRYVDRRDQARREQTRRDQDRP